MDLDVFNMFKPKNNNENKEENFSDKDQIFALLQALEKKTFKKFEFIDERVKKSEEEIYKIKNELTNTKTSVENSIKFSHQNIEKCENNLAIIIGDNYNKIKDSINLLDSTLIDRIKNSSELGEKKLDEIINNLQNQINDIKGQQSIPITSLKKSSNIDEDEFKIIRDLSKKQSELEKSFKILANNSNFEKEIAKINENMLGKATKNETTELGEHISNLQFIIDKLNHSIDFLTETLNQFNEDKKITSDDLVWIKKKIELTNKMILSSNSGVESPNPHANTNKLILDTSRFIDISIFHDFREEIYKDYNIHKNKIEEIKRYIEELLILINTKVSEKESKNMECNFLIKKP